LNKDIVTFAIIGVSGIADVHIRAILKYKYSECKYVFSRDTERAEKFANRYGLIVSKSYRDILINDAVDAVIIVTEPERHANLAIEAIKKGKHVLIEKPIDINISRAKKVVTLAKNSDVICGVVSQKRFDPVVMKMKNDLDNGRIGKPFYAEINVMWSRDDNYYKKGTGWRAKYGSVLLNQAIHYLDLAIWFFGNPLSINSVNRMINNNLACNDTSLILLTFPNDIICSFSSSTACKNSQPVQFKIYGNKGELDYQKEQELISKDNEGRISIIESLLNRLLNKRMKKKVYHDDFYFQIKNFVDSIIDNKEPIVNAEEALNVLQIIKQCDN
jgi:UDP-N-acetyl-2-amino-2-deoxyglucuronate dehydrogenase